MPYTSKQTNYVKIFNNQKDYQDIVESADKHAQSLFLIQVEAKSVQKKLNNHARPGRVYPYHRRLSDRLLNQVKIAFIIASKETM